MAFVIKCHKMAFYGILWQMPYAINCHKVWQYGYQKNRVDQTNWLLKGKSFHRSKIKQKKSLNVLVIHVQVKTFRRPQIDLSDYFGSFDTHIAILYVILCHMAFGMKCHIMPFYSLGGYTDHWWPPSNNNHTRELRIRLYKPDAKQEVFEGCKEYIST